MNKSEIHKATKQYGHLINKDSRITNYIFADLIRDNYTLSNPITMQAWKAVSEASNLIFKRETSGFIRVVRI